MIDPAGWRLAGLRPGSEWIPRKAFGGIEVDRRLAPSAPVDAVGGMGAGDRRLYVVPSRQLVVVRHGGPAGEMAAAGGAFDETFWRHLSPAMPDTQEVGQARS